MKKLFPVLALLALLTACGGQAPSPSASPAPSTSAATAQEIAQAILDTATFSDTLEIVEADVAYTLYGLTAEDVADCAVYLSTGASAEECAILVMKDEEGATAALEGFQARVEDQTEALADYQPGELAKLEKATYGTRAHAEGTLVYLVVAEDMAGIFEAINS